MNSALVGTAPKDLSNTAGKPSLDQEIEAAIAIWKITEPDKMPTEAIQKLINAARSALLNDRPSALATELMRTPSPKQIAGIVAELIAAYPAREKQDVAIFTRLMAEELMMTSAGFETMRAAGRAVIRGCTFPPSIAEVLAAVEERRIFDLTRVQLLGKLLMPVEAAERILAKRAEKAAVSA